MKTFYIIIFLIGSTFLINPFYTSYKVSAINIRNTKTPDSFQVIIPFKYNHKPVVHLEILLQLADLHLFSIF